MSVAGALSLAPTRAEPGILLVEDDHGDAVLVQPTLGQAGIAADSVIWKRTLAEGCSALADEPICVLLDLGLPDAS